LIARVTVSQTNRPVGNFRSLDSSTTKVKANSTNSCRPIGRIHEAHSVFFDEASRLLVSPLLRRRLSAERLVNLSPGPEFTATFRD